MRIGLMILEILKCSKHTTTFVTFPSALTRLTVAPVRSILILEHFGFKIVRNFIKTSIASSLASYLHKIVLLNLLLKHVATCFS
jgi:hypothetical protein